MITKYLRKKFPHITKEDLKRIRRYEDVMGLKITWYQRLFILNYLNSLSYYYFSMKDEYDKYKQDLEKLS